MTKLTAIMLTRHRPRCVAAPLRFFKGCDRQHLIIVADGSSVEHAEDVRGICEGMAEYHHFESAAQSSSWSRFIGHSVIFVNDRYPKTTASGQLASDADWTVVPTSDTTRVVV